MEGANSGKNTFKCEFLHFACHQILSILTIAANIGSCPRTTLPLPHGFFYFAVLLRVAISRLYCSRRTLSYLTKKNTTVIWFSAWTAEIC